MRWNAKPPESLQVRRDHDFRHHLHCLHRARTSTRKRSRGITKSPSSVWTICFLSYGSLTKVLASGPTCGMSPCRRLVDALHVHEKSSSRHHAHLSASRACTVSFIASLTYNSNPSPCAYRTSIYPLHSSLSSCCVSHYCIILSLHLSHSLSCFLLCHWLCPC